MTGRLGNQMFQYSTLRAFQEKYRQSDNLVLHFNWLAGSPRMFPDSLKDFNVKMYKNAPKVLDLTLKQKILIKYIRFWERYINHFYEDEKIFQKQNCFDRRHARMLMRHGIYSIHNGYEKLLPPPSLKVIFFDGCFESPKYFNDIRPQLLEEFTPKHNPLKTNQDLYKSIHESESVCVTIRRGDFVDNPDFKKNHYVCTPEFFAVSIQKMQTLLKNPKFFIFSDDINWVKQNMTFPKGTEYETGNDPVWEKLRLMYSCKHFIISNSTFSWWAQYLSRNANKIVIAPSRWKNFYPTLDIYEDNWILIDPTS